MGHELARVLDEVREQAEFGRRQCDVGAAQPGPVIVEVDNELAVSQPACGRSGALVAARRKGRLDPGDELRERTPAW